MWALYFEYLETPQAEHVPSPENRESCPNQQTSDFLALSTVNWKEFQRSLREDEVRTQLQSFIPHYF